MSNPTPLSYEKHAKLKIDSRPNAGVGDAVNRTLAFSTEFGELHREFPILFYRDAATGAYQAHVILGFDRDENLFLGEDGWRCKYVPAMLARGPFLIGAHAQDGGGAPQSEPVVLIDTDDPRVGVEHGEALFRPDGNGTPYLDGILRSLRVIHQGRMNDEAFFESLAAMNLIEPVSIKVTLSNIEQTNLHNYHTINEERLSQLDGSSLKAMNSKGILGLVFFALSSLGNMKKLIEIKNRKAALA